MRSRAAQTAQLSVIAPPDGESHAMFLLGRIAAIACHEPGPRFDKAMLPAVASHPAKGFWLLASRLNEADGCGRRKRQAFARLGRALPHPLPPQASRDAQASFWAGYCAYWNDMLKTHSDRANERVS